MPNHTVFSDKERELIALSASVAAGCRPCTERHVAGAQVAGACVRSVALAVETAVTVRQSATKAMEEWAAQCHGTQPEVDQAFRDGKRLIAELESVAAAAAVNSGPDLETHVRAASATGATPEQLRAAIAIGGAAKRAAEHELGDAGGKCCEPAPAAAATNCGCK